MGDLEVIRIPIKNGDIDAALDKLNTAKKEQDKAFNERLAAVLAAPTTGQSAKPQPPQQQPKRPPAPSYESILARSRRMG
ncbi:MAG: hypothetical protein JSR61_21160 [Proteobacteria bacterium]|nr:hypothetical protein [Pseudomonadota bacterium]